MKTSARFLLPQLFAVAFIAVVFAPLAARAVEAGAKPTASATSGELAPVSDKTDAAWLGKSRAEYPMDRCSVSGDKFDGGEMGKPLDYVYKQAGKPDRLVRFCCKDCIADFKKDPAKYLKAIDDAAAAKMSAVKR